MSDVQLRRVVRQFYFDRARLNVPSDEFRSIAIHLFFVTLRRVFKKAGSILFDVGDS